MNSSCFSLFLMLLFTCNNVVLKKVQEKRSVQLYKRNCTNSTCEYTLRVSDERQPTTLQLVTNSSDLYQLKTLIAQLHTDFKKDAEQSTAITKGLTTSLINLTKLVAMAENKLNATDTEIAKIQKKVETLERTVTAMNMTTESHRESVFIYPELPRNVTELIGADCTVLQQSGFNTSGVYVLQPDPNDSSLKFNAFCDMENHGGGWTVIQRRVDGSEDFFRDWTTYKHGFGDLRHDFWLGLNNIHILTKLGNTKLRINLRDWDDEERFSEFSFTRVADESDGYRIMVGKYSGDGGDPFHTQRFSNRMQSMRFSTFDNDNDLDLRGNCAATFTSGWWFNSCFLGNLNGVWYSNYSYISSSNNGIIWDLWNYHPRGYSLKSAEMKLRRN